MRTILFLLLSTVGCLAQFPFSGQTWYQPVVSSGITGSPNLQSYTTNSATTGTSFNLTVDPEGANRIMIFRADWFPNTSTANTPTWNGSSTGVTVLTNALWDSAAIGEMKAWCLVAPSTGSHTANFSFGAGISEVTYTVYVFTNANQSAYPAFFTGITSTNSTTGVTSHTNNVVSTVGDYVLGMITVANSAETINAVGPLTNIASLNPGTSMHQSCGSGTNAASTTTKLNWTWSSGFRVGSIGLSIK